MRFILVVLIAASSFALGAPAAAQESAADQQEAAKPTAELTLTKLATVKTLRCDALSRAKRATRKALIYQNDTSLGGQLGMVAEEKVSQAQAEAGALYEEASSLKKRLAGMVDRFNAAQRLLWYETVDEAERIHIEERILTAKEMAEEPCED